MRSEFIDTADKTTFNLAPRAPWQTPSVTAKPAMDAEGSGGLNNDSNITTS